MQDGPSIILLEFNELSPHLMTRFMEQEKLPHFHRFYQESLVFVTEAVERPPALEPWIQWVNVHSGVDYRDHGIFSLDEGHLLKHKNVWEILSAAGYRVWVCGSMNVNHDAPPNGCFIPDPWTTKVSPHPPSLVPYCTFIQKNVVEHTNDRIPLPVRDYLRFAAFMATHGLSLETCGSIARQLLGELSGTGRWKRAVILDKLQFDVFHWYYERLKPQFCTFFLNSTAHFQHLYWRNMEPDVFQVRPSSQEQEVWGRAVLFGYQQMDRLIGRFMKLAGEETTLIFCTALSQQPCLKYEELGGKCFYRPRDFERLLAFAGFRGPYRAAPLMSEEFHVYFVREPDAAFAETCLKGLRVGNSPAVNVTRDGLVLRVGCRIFDQLPSDVTLSRVDGSALIRFFEIFYQVEGLKSGMHHPEGLLWIRTPERRHHEETERIPLSSIAPTILKLFSVSPPEFMRGQPLSLVTGASPI